MTRNRLNRDNKEANNDLRTGHCAHPACAYAGRDGLRGSAGRHDFHASSPSAPPAIAAFLGGLGAFLWSSVILDDTGDFFVEGFILGSIFLIILWIAGVFLMYAHPLDGIWRATDLGRARSESRRSRTSHSQSPFSCSSPGSASLSAILAIAAMFFYSNFAITRGVSSDRPATGDARRCRGLRCLARVLPILTSTGQPVRARARSSSSGAKTWSRTSATSAT